MNIEFDYQPCDRVTAMINGKLNRAISIHDYSAMFKGGQMASLEVAYLDTFGSFLNNLVGVNKIRPGHYDEKGNWTPKPGDPCYAIEDGVILPFTVIGTTKDIVRVIGDESYKVCFFKIFGDKAIETFSLVDDEVGHDIPESSILRPGRPKINKQ